MKKAPVREYTALQSFKHLISLMSEREKTAYISPVGKEYVSLSYKDFADMTLRATAGFAAVGLAGKRVAVIGETSPEWVATYIGVVASGGVIIPMDKELAIEEIEGFLAGVEAEAIVYAKSFNEKLAHAIEAHSGYEISHGRAVGMGMHLVTAAAWRNATSAEERTLLRQRLTRLDALLVQYGLTVECPYAVKTLLPYLSSDKKHSDGVLHLVVPLPMGGCTLQRLSPQQTKEFFER